MVFFIMVMVLGFMLSLLSVCLFSQSVQLCRKGLLLFHDVEDLLSIQLIPVCCHDIGIFVKLSQHCHYLVQLLLAHALNVAEDNGAGVLNLVLVELAEVLHVHLALLGVNYCCETVKLNLVVVKILNGNNDVTEFSYSRWLYEDPLRIVVSDNLVQSPSKISHQCAADASCVHLIYLNSSILQEALIYAYLSELVFNKNYLFPLVGFCYQFLDQCCLSCSKEAGKNIYLCHFFSPSDWFILQE